MFKIATHARSRVVWAACFIFAGALSLCSVRPANVGDAYDLPRELRLPSTRVQRWILTIEVDSPANFVQEPSKLTQELEKLVAETATLNGLELLGLSSIGPKFRGLKVQTHLRSEVPLLLGSAVDGDEDEDVSEGNLHEDVHSSLFLRAVVTSAASDSSTAVSSLVRIAHSSAITSGWLSKLSSAGLPVTAVKVVSLAPHAPVTVEAQLQGKLKLLREELAAAEADAAAELKHVALP